MAADMIPLPEWLELAIAEPIGVPETMCARFAAAWWGNVTGRDPRPTFPALYSPDALALMAAAGGLIGIIGRHAAAGGLVRTPDPAGGDIGVIAVPDITGVGQPTCAVRTASGRWMVRTDHGLAALRRPVLAAWRIEEA